MPSAKLIICNDDSFLVELLVSQEYFLPQDQEIGRKKRYVRGKEGLLSASSPEADCDANHFF